MSRDLTYDAVNKIYDAKGKNPVHALRDVSFTIRAGELFCLLGPSGCGKTTLLRSTAGLESISSGKMLYGDVDISTIPPYKRNIGMVFQSFALYPHMTIFENVAYGLRVRKIPEEVVRKKVVEAMAVGDRMAVMRKGIVEQIGTSDELYNQPNSSFVANFIGKMNFFNSRIVGIEDGRILCEVDGTGLVIPVCKTRNHVSSLSLGKEVLVGARPEQLVVGKQEGKVRGTVRIIQHLGQFIRYEVELDPAVSRAIFEIDMPSLQADVKEHDTVCVEVKPDVVSLFDKEVDA